MDLKELDFSPSTRLFELKIEEFQKLFLSMARELYVFKGKRFSEPETIKSVEVLFFKMRGKFLNLNLNDVAFLFEMEMESEMFHKISGDYLLNKLTQRSGLRDKEEREAIQSKSSGKYAPLWGMAVRLRMSFDKGGKRLESGEYDMKQVYEALKDGYNFFTSEEIIIT